MTLRIFLWGIRIGTLISLLSWAMVVYNIDPDRSGTIGRTLFYLSLFLSVSGIFILFLSWIKRRMEKDESIPEQIGISFRQGMLLAALVIILLIFQDFKMLVWWDGLLVTAGIFLIELYFLSK